MADQKGSEIAFERMKYSNFASEQLLTIMKKKIFSLMLGVVLAAPSFASQIADPAIPIPIIRTKPSSEGTHRTPEVIPIVCLVDADGLNVSVSFLSGMGDVDIILENQFTGEYSLSSVDSSLGGAVIPFSGTSGNWIITFSFHSGVEYEGEFEI